jgi:hypothetical protein
MLTGIYLTLLIGPTIPVPAPQPVVDALESVQVTTSAGQRSGFQLVFGLSGNSLLESLIAAGYFDPDQRVILVATINGLPSVLCDGVITRQDVAPNNEIGAAALTVTGEDISLVMDLVQMNGVPHPALPDEAIVAMVLGLYARFGLIPAIIPSPFTDVPVPIDYIPTQTGTDLAYIQQLASENGYVFYVEPGPLPGTNVAYWGPEIRIGVPQPALNIGMDAETNVESLSFGFDGLSREQTVILVQDPITKLSIPVPLPDITLLRPPLALRQAPALRIRQLCDAAKHDVIKAATLGLSKAASSSDAVTGQGQLDVLRYGHVLKARGLVGVRGAGMAYDGLYYVKSVTHSIKPGEYKQSFQLARNGLISLLPAVVP